MAIAPPFESAAYDGLLDVRDAVALAADALSAAGSTLMPPDDADLVELARDVEALGRRVDALRVSIAGEIESRSDGAAGEEGLAARHGCRTAIELLERLTLCAPRSITARLRLARETRMRTNVLGEQLPALLLRLGEVLREGGIGMDAALTIADGLRDAGRVCARNDLAAAERALVGAAIGRLPGDGVPADPGAPTACTVGELRIQTGLWALWLDQDGVEPRAESAERRRGLTLGAEADGLTPLRGLLTPEVAARLRRLIDAHLAPGRPVTFSGVGGAGVPWTDEDAPVDPRSRAQRQHDLLAVLLDAAARAEDAPTIGGSSPTVLITVSAEDLAAENGVAHADGVDAPLPAGVARRHLCTNPAQRILFDRMGRVIGIDSPERLFNAHQRRAILLRDGGCVIPGCSIPAGWCEVHHVTDHSRGGPTTTDNGVLLCWWHHHHLERSGWAIRMRGGVPEVRAPLWSDMTRAWRPSRRAPVHRWRRE